MANITFEVDLTSPWADLTTAHSLENGETYLVDIVQIQAGSKIQSALTDSTDAPTDISGHPWEPVAWAESLNQKEYEQKPGRFLWARVSSGTAKLIFTKL
ncbi:MAG: hypothetical protein OXE42_01300 [Gammaproteobacteria bacterium]|nr:hypothetical protein [Gammaproteobacteria bacterium]